MSKDKGYLKIIEHYEDCLAKHGDTHLGVDWPKKEDADTRYRVMLDVIKERGSEVSLLDFGCGTAHLYEYIKKNSIPNIKYSGLDLSEKFIVLSKQKFPSAVFYSGDILENPDVIPAFDYIVMNGVFTEKRELEYIRMLDYFKEMVRKVFLKANLGIALNVMSAHVDWERDDLFHLPFDQLATFLTKEVSRNFIIRNDYGLYEYTVYIYK